MEGLAGYGWDAIAVAFGISLLAGISTGVGGLIVALKSTPSNTFLAGALGFSTGVMVYISLVEMLPEAAEEVGGPSAVAAFFAGVGLIALIDRLVPEEVNPHEEHVAASSPALARAGTMTGLAIALHNFPEGFASFMSALADPVLAAPIALAIAIHNVPEGVAVAAPLREATGKKWRAAGWATLSGLAEPAGALIGFLLLLPFLGPSTLGLAYAAVAGIMVFISFDKLLPSAIHTGHHHHCVYGVVGGMAVMAVSLLLLP
ncbi:zinc transporter ZupT [Corynebacterium timonense]|uniref:Zinc transporter ZupT n=1 Tax=Corynebacterium timonense TaxID=441500 RepID=A0A1H1L624_9CORY|nr:zinc transporter ZupT [Corynebacterium timonense]SDR69998.1 zinc transporter, ZIP family [Corynebacterium timonense]